jgi:Ni/Fe-hydrogenase subunit HybB-like protein
MNFWFGAFLFGGFLIALRDLYWPFKLFYYIMPFSYYVRSSTYVLFEHMTFEPCTDSKTSAVCVDSTSGLDVLDDLGRVVGLYSADDQVVFDLGMLIVIGVFYKLWYIVGVLYKTSVVAKIHDN